MYVWFCIRICTHVYPYAINTHTNTLMCIYIFFLSEFIESLYFLFEIESKTKKSLFCQELLMTDKEILRKNDYFECRTSQPRYYRLNPRVKIH